MGRCPESFGTNGEGALVCHQIVYTVCFCSLADHGLDLGVLASSMQGLVELWNLECLQLTAHISLSERICCNSCCKDFNWTVYEKLDRTIGLKHS